MKNIYHVTLRVDEGKLLANNPGADIDMIEQLIKDSVDWQGDTGIELSTIELSGELLACDHCNKTLFLGSNVVSVDDKFYCSNTCLFEDLDVIVGELDDSVILGLGR